MTEYRYPRFLRIVIAVCLPLSLLLAVISWLAYQIDGATVGLYLLPVWVLMAAYWGYTLATMPQRVCFEREQLVIDYGWWYGWRYGQRRLAMPYADIHTVRMGPLGLLIAGTQGQVTLSRVLPNLVAAIQGELEQRVPVAQARFRHRFAEFPLSLRARRVAPIFSLLFGLFLVAVAVGTLNYTFAVMGEVSAGNWLFMLVMSGAWLALGLGLCYAVLCCYVWRYTFTATTIYARYTLWQRQWLTSELRAIEWVGEESTYRGVTRTSWRIELIFADGDKLAVSPSQWGGWLDRSEVQDALRLRQLLDRLRALYFVSSTESRPVPHTEACG